MNRGWQAPADPAASALTKRSTRMPACPHARTRECGGATEEGNQMHRRQRLAGRIGSHRKSITYLSAALVMAGAGTAGAATIGAASADAATTNSASPAPIAAVTTAYYSPVTASAHGTPMRAGTGTGRAARTWAHRWARRAGHPGPAPHTFLAVRDELNWQTNPALAAHGITPPADKLLPVPTAGPQSFMPISPAQYGNATAIVQQALARRMGLRSAVIAVATAMQESQLLNVDYGTGDSLGLFQQQSDMGWGTPQQIMEPAYAAGVFLNALRGYQASDPAWASQPLYAAAQGVQRSAFPFAYAQWEIQAAQLTSSIVMHLR
jgi:hypothetical protein